MVQFVLLIGLSTTAFSQNCDTLSRDSITDPGIYHVATLTEDDSIRNGSDYSNATIYYPTDAQAPFASIAIVPGYVSLQFTMKDWGPFLASHGIVVMTIGTNNIFENPYQRKDALLDAIVTIKKENTRMGSPLFGQLDTSRMAVAGWSMGGGGAQLAAVADTSLKAVIALCPWLNDETVAEDLNHPVPTLIFSAELDVIAPHASHADVYYGFTPQTTDKLIFEVNNGGHAVANNPTGGDGEVGQIALAWLKQYLLDEPCYCPLLVDTPATASAFITNVRCPDSTTPFEESTFQITLTLGKGKVKLEVDSFDEETQYEVLSEAGEKVSGGAVQNATTQIDVFDLPVGVYFVNVFNEHISKQLEFNVQ